VAASLTALSRVTITGRAYVEMWSDRHCPTLEPSNVSNDGFSTKDPIATCKNYKLRQEGMDPAAFTADDQKRAEELTGNTGSEFFDRDGGARFLVSIAAEIAAYQRWNLYGVLEGAPFQDERALFTSMFSAPMADSDFILYLRVGTSYKF